MKSLLALVETFACLLPGHPAVTILTRRGGGAHFAPFHLPVETLGDGKLRLETDEVDYLRAAFGKFEVHWECSFSSARGLPS